MNIEQFRLYCLNKKGVSEDFPFDSNTLVFKVCGKMFALTDVNNFESVNLKCDPEKAIELRELYNWVKPGYHMSKKHWNTIEITWELEEKQFFNWVDESYHLVVQGLTKKERELLNKI